MVFSCRIYNIQMIQHLLTGAYLILAAAAFIYWIGAVLSMFSMLKHKAPGTSLLITATIGWLKDENFTEEGVYHRRKFFRSSLKFFLIVLAMFLVVLMGVQTQS